MGVIDLDFVSVVSIMKKIYHIITDNMVPYPSLIMIMAVILWV